VRAGIDVGEQPGDPLGLLNAWEGRAAAVIVDAMRCDGARPGTLRRFDVGRTPLPAERTTPASTHTAGVGEVIELARTLGRLPPRIIVYAVRGARFALGSGLSIPVRAALPALGEAVLADALALRDGRSA
jgi:hydrogenase maturation protease